MVHPIRVVSHRTGLSQHVIRMWERRYGVVIPQRSGTNRRLYSDQDIEKLRLLRGVTQEGHSIGIVAGLNPAELQGLLDQAKETRNRSFSQAEKHPSPNLKQVLHAIRMYDRASLEGALRLALLTWGNQGALLKLIVPLAREMEKSWQNGELTVAHEHFASSIIKAFLLSSIRNPASLHHAPVLIAATLTGQFHELGALIASTAASNMGWKVIYLGSNLPASEITCAAHQNHALAVTLNLAFPPDDPSVPQELHHLRQLLRNEVQIVAGGQACACYSYSAALDQIGAHRFQNLEEFHQSLHQVRSSQPEFP